jgi:hypothetical protein
MRITPGITALGCASLALVTTLSWFLLGSERGMAKPPLRKPLQMEAVSPTPVSEETMDAGVQSSTTATITIWTVPYTTANVFWGKKLLGKIVPGRPLVIVRPRDSGPLDLMVRAGGYLSVQTRAHTFNDSKVVVKLTKPDKKNELLGYRIPLDGGLEGGLPEGGLFDAGVRPDAALPSMPPGPAPMPPSMF